MCDSSSYAGYYPPFCPNVVTSSTGVFPSVTDFAGNLNFDIILDPNDSVKKKWLFSDIVKKVFIDIDKTIGITFRWNSYGGSFPSASSNTKFIRALPVYTQDDWLRIPVERCEMHKCHKDDINTEQPYVNHVLRCENEGTRYEVDHESGRRSCVTMVVPFDYKDSVVLHYKFVCKTSCYRGMQRRPVVVIFTLEDEHGNVLGRRCLSFKVCSCLKRDMHREEAGVKKIKRRKLTNATNRSNQHNIVSSSVNGSGLLPRRFNMSSGETVRPFSLMLFKLNLPNAEHALRIIHSTLLGELAMNNIEGAELVIDQVRDYLNQIQQYNNTYHQL